MKKQFDAKFLIIAMAAAVICLLGSSISVFAQAKIKYNAVYDCGEGKLKIKILSCDGQGREATCEVLYVNKYSPGGGSRSTLERAFIEDNYLRQCPVEGGNAAEATQAAQDKTASEDQPTGNQTTAENDATDAASCQPSDDPSGKTNGDIFKRLIIERYAHQPESGRDQTTTVNFQSFKLGATHQWRPGQGGESPDGPGGKSGTTIYPVKALYTVCTDLPGYKPTGYRGEVQKQQSDNVFYCFKNQFGEWQCNLGEGKNGEIKFFPK